MQSFIEKCRQFDLDLLSKRQFYAILFAIFFVGAFIRFWNLDQFNKLVFDEVYFPKFAYDYLNQDRFFHVHPPLGKYTQAAGIWIYNHLPWVDDPAIGTVELAELNAHSWRWVNATFGSFLILIVGFTVLLLTRNRLFTLLAALFVMVDGSLIVASRYGLSNVQIVFFGFLSMYFLVKSLTAKTNHRRWLIICGLFLGCTYSIKWNGLGYSLIAWCILIGATLCLYADKELAKVEASLKNKEDETTAKKKKKSKAKKEEVIETSAAAKIDSTSVFARIKLYEYVGYLMILPAILYASMWIPDLNLNSRHAEYGFIGMHKQMSGYHGKTIGADVHPYCSKWYTWPILKRPISYYFNKKNEKQPDGEFKKIVRDVHLFGNPALYWMGVAALVWVIIMWLYSALVWVRLGVIHQNLMVYSFITFGFLANFLPWMLVSRCTFFYHYQSASVFKFLALAWVTSELFKAKALYFKGMAAVIVLLVISAFIYWLPINLGLPIESSSYYSKMWFRSWI